MPKTIPLIRASAMIPMINWLRAQGRPVQHLLDTVDLAYIPFDNPMAVAPLFNVAAFFREMARAEGPDIGCRVITENTLLDLAMVGKVLLGASTPRESLARAVAVMPFHCTAEHFQLVDEGDQIRFVEGWSVNLDAETLHVTQQFVASVMALLARLAERRAVSLDRVELVPHPQHGLAHLTPWFGKPVHPAKGKALTVLLATSIADRPYRHVGRDRTIQLMSGLTPLDSHHGLADSARPVIAAMLETATPDSGMPTVDRLARAAGLSLRTLQRRLAEEDSSFTLILEAARREAALHRISTCDSPFAAVSATLGFARQSALTRAVRRWTGQAPSTLRKNARG